MNSLQRFKNLMSFNSVDRLPIIEWADYWDKTLVNWYDEGLSKKLTDSSDIRMFLGLDRYLQLWIPPRASSCPKPPFHGAAIINDERHIFIPNPHSMKKNLKPGPENRHLAKP